MSRSSKKCNEINQKQHTLSIHLRLFVSTSEVACNERIDGSLVGIASTLLMSTHVPSSLLCMHASINTRPARPSSAVGWSIITRPCSPLLVSRRWKAVYKFAKASIKPSGWPIGVRHARRALSQSPGPFLTSVCAGSVAGKNCNFSGDSWSHVNPPLLP